MSADISNIKVGQAPAGTKQFSPAAPAATPAVPQVPTAPAPIVVPSAGSSRGGIMKKLIYGVVGLLILGGIAYAVMSIFSGGSTPQTSVSPSPSGTPTPTLGGKSLRSYFPQAGPSISLRDDDSARPDLINAIATSNPASKQAVRLSITVAWPDTSAYGFLSAMTGSAPSALASTLGSDWAVLSYGQQEQFDASGVLIQNPTPSPRFMLIAEVTDATAANQVMTAWESASLASSADLILGYNTAKAIVHGFSSGSYRQIPVRYWNFPYADRSIDYALVTASNNKNYLVIAGSREAAFFAIDQLMQ